MASLFSTALVEITCADASALLDECNRKGIPIYSLTQKGQLTVTASVYLRDLPLLNQLANKYGGSLKVLKTDGFLWTICRFFHRPVLLLGICLILVLGAWLPTRVLFIAVEGNVTVPSKYIMEQAEQCGIVFGASRRVVRSEKMKNRLLGAIPSLQWAGVNTSGCTAVISVKERTEESEVNAFRGVCSIVAQRDGIIESCTSLRGNLLCKVGQSVQKGDVLISGLTDTGLCVKATNAAGEIYAHTKHEITVLMPLDYRQKRDQSALRKNYGIIIGKKRINFSKDSGISGVGCDKIYLEYYVTLPGGFQLPLGIFVCSIADYDYSAMCVSADELESFAQQTAQRYLLSQMISGKILHAYTVTEEQENVCVLTGRYVCSEMIGRVQYEEITQNYGENNGENR